MQAEIAEAAYQAQIKIESQDQVIVGVNMFQDEENKTDLKQLKVDPVIEIQQRKHLAQLKTQRNGSQVSECLNLIDQAARSADDPLMSLFIHAVTAGCTLGEICGVLRERWGEYQGRISI